MQTVSYPVLIQGNDDIGFTATVRDIPELITQGESFYECLEMIHDAFDTVREMYAEFNREYPVPSEPLSNEILIDFVL